VAGTRYGYGYRPVPFTVPPGPMAQPTPTAPITAGSTAGAIPTMAGPWPPD
jgi:hypothetical protein